MRRYSRPLFFLLLAGFGLLAAGSVLWITPFGAGANPDSIIFLEAAKSLHSGQGFTLDGQPVTHFPPLYSLFLAGAFLIVRDPLQAARWLNALLCAVNAGLLTYIVFQATERDLLAGALSGLFFLVSAPVLSIHGHAWSEPLFLTFTLANLLLLASYVIRPNPALLLGSALCTACAILTRYVGLALLPAAALFVLLSGEGLPLRRRLRNALAWLALAALPILLLIARNMLAGGSATNRLFTLHVLPLPIFFSLLFDRLSNFVAPFVVPAGLRHIALVALALALLGLLLAGLVLRAVRRPPPGTSWRSMPMLIPLLSLAFALAYLLVLYLSLSFLDASTPMDGRILMPVYILLIVFLFCAVWVIAKALGQPLAWWVFLLLVGLSIAIKWSDTAPTLSSFHASGLGYRSRPWLESESLAFVRSLPPGAVLYSNGDDIIRFLTGRPTAGLPQKYAPTSLIENPEYAASMRAVCQELGEGQARLLLFDTITYRGFLPNEEEIGAFCKLSLVEQFADGRVYRVER